MSKILASFTTCHVCLSYIVFYILLLGSIGPTEESRAQASAFTVAYTRSKANRSQLFCHAQSADIQHLYVSNLRELAHGDCISIVAHLAGTKNTHTDKIQNSKN